QRGNTIEQGCDLLNDFFFGSCNVETVKIFAYPRCLDACKDTLVEELLSGLRSGASRILHACTQYQIVIRACIRITQRSWKHKGLPDHIIGEIAVDAHLR